MKATDLKALYLLSFDQAEEKIVETAANIRMKHSLTYSQCLDSTAHLLGFTSFEDLHKNLKDNCLQSEITA